MRDLKPANIRITLEGKGRILDFDVATPIETFRSISLTGETR